jgi:hypothetical protein
MTASPIVVTADPAITVSQDTPAITAIVPVTQFPLDKSGFSLSVELVAEQDFNTATTAGFYNTIDDMSPNAPISGHFWYLQVDVDGDNPTNFIRQTATILDATAATYQRTLVNGAWGAWQPFVTLDPSGRLPPVDGSQLTNVNSGLSSKILNSIGGLTLSTAGGTALFSVAAGAANDSTNAMTMVLASALAKSTNSWSSGNGNGALDTGSIAASTWYHVFLISNSTASTVDVLISLSLTPALPTGFTLFRRLGSMLTNGSSDWTLFIQVGNEFLWSVPAADIAVTNLATTATLFTLSVPPGVQVHALIRGLVASANANTRALINSPDEATAAANTPAGNNTAFPVNTNSSAGAQFTLSVRTNTSGQIRAVSNAGTTTLDVATYGWTDARGQL